MPKTNTDQTPAFKFAERVAAEIRRTQLLTFDKNPDNASRVLSEQSIRGIVMEQLRHESEPLSYGTPATDRALEETGSRIVDFDVPVSITFPITIGISIPVTAVASCPIREVVRLAKKSWNENHGDGAISHAFDVGYSHKDIAEVVYESVESAIADNTLRVRFPRSGETDDITYSERD